MVSGLRVSAGSLAAPPAHGGPPPAYAGPPPPAHAGPPPAYAGPPPAHRGPPPAVVGLLAGRPARDGFRATLLDLAARGWFQLRQPGVLIGGDAMRLTGPVTCVLPSATDLTNLLPYERRAVAHLAWHARVRGEVAADAVIRAISAGGLRAFRDELADDARARGLTRPAPSVTRWRTGRDPLTSDGRAVLAVWRQRCARSGPVAGLGRDVAYAAALGAAPLAPFAHRGGNRGHNRRERVARWLRLPRRARCEFDGHVLRQWEVDRGSAEGIVQYVAIDDGARVRTFRIPSHLFEMLTPGALVHAQADPRRDELLGVRPIDHRAILPVCM